MCSWWMREENKTEEITMCFPGISPRNSNYKALKPQSHIHSLTRKTYEDLRASLSKTPIQNLIWRATCESDTSSYFQADNTL